MKNQEKQAGRKASSAGLSYAKLAGRGVEMGMDGLFVQTYTVALPVVLTSCMGYIVWLLKQQKRDRDANSRGTMLMLRAKLIEYHKDWTERQYVTKHGLENFLEMYDAYHELGGNGMVTHLLEEVKELQIKG